MACLCYEKFLKYKICKMDEASLVTSIWLNALIVGSIDLLQKSIEIWQALSDTKADDKTSSDRNKISQRKSRQWRGKYKRGRILQEFAVPIRSLLPLAFSKAFCNSSKVILEACKQNKITFVHELAYQKMRKEVKDLTMREERKQKCLFILTTIACV